MTLNISKVLSLGSKMSMTALALSASLWLTSCNDDDTTVNVTVQNVLINSDDTNALRYPVSVATSGDCDVTIKYWPRKGARECAHDPYDTHLGSDRQLNKLGPTYN